MTNQPQNSPVLPFRDRLLAGFRASEERMNGETKSPLHQVRRAALQTFETLGFPTTKHEEWKYSNVMSLINKAYEIDQPSTISAEDLDSLQIPNLSGNILCFVNGQYRADLSRIVSPTSEVQIMSFREALTEQSEAVGAYFSRLADFQDNAFTALNTAFASDGVFIRVPDGKTVTEPIIMRFITDARTNSIAAQPRNLIIVGRNA